MASKTFSKIDEVYDRFKAFRLSDSRHVSPHGGTTSTSAASSTSGTKTQKASSISTSTKNTSDAAKNAAAAKKVSVRGMVVYGLIQMVPIAPFAIYASVYNTSGGMPALPYFIGFIGMLFTVFSFAVMIPLFPSSGSIYTYCSKAISPVVGFIAGWLMLLQYLVTPDLMFIQAGQALNQYIQAIPVWAWCLLFLLFVTLVSIRSLKNTIRIDKIALIAELVVFAGFIVLGIRYIILHPETSSFDLSNIFNPSKFQMGGMMDAVSLCAMSFVGFGCVATLTGEAQDPKKGPSRAMLIIVLILGAMFVGLCYITSCIDCKVAAEGTTQAAIMKSNPNTGFYLLADKIGGGWYGTVCAVANALALGVFTGLAATISISRVIYVMSQSGALPKKLGIMNEKTQVPISATLFVNALSLVMIFFLINFGMTNVAKLSNFGALSTYCLLNICVLWYCFFRKQEKLSFVRSLVLPLLGALVTGAIFFSITPQVAFIGWIWVGFGILYYLVATRVLKHKINLG